MGKGKSYAKLEEFQARNLRFEDIDLSGVYSELDYFTKQAVTGNIFDYAKKEEAKWQQLLS